MPALVVRFLGTFILRAVKYMVHRSWFPGFPSGSLLRLSPLSPDLLALHPHLPLHAQPCFSRLGHIHFHSGIGDEIPGRIHLADACAHSRTVRSVLGVRHHDVRGVDMVACKMAEDGVQDVSTA